jgi:biotin synthase
MSLQIQQQFESPELLRMSLAAAMTLGFKQGLFYRKAKLTCINLLLTYGGGCAARCAYCGLSRKRPGDYEAKSFIRVSWPAYSLLEIIDRIRERQDRVKRICVSMITHKHAMEDTKQICRRLRCEFDIPVSLLITPTILSRDDLIAFKAAGADKIGVAIDLATEALFDRYRGKGVRGPHKWQTYWHCLAEAIEVFGEGNAGSHFMTGMGETEKEMCQAMQRVKDMGGGTHLFSFFPEGNSQMSNHPMPPMDQYRRIQIARYIIDQGQSRADFFRFDKEVRIADFGITGEFLGRLIDSGEPFRTSGCEGYDGEVACNRPFANSRPGPLMRNYPFSPNRGDIQSIRKQVNLKITKAGDAGAG